MPVSASSVFISVFALRSAANHSVRFGVFIFGNGKDQRASNTNSDGTTPLGLILSLIASVLMHSMWLLSNSFCSVLRM